MKPTRNFDFVKSTLHRVITSDTLDSVALVRVPKDVARRLNSLVGSPIASKEELQARRDAAEKLASLRTVGGVEKAKHEPAPVLVYFEKGRNERELARVEDLLKSKDVKYTLSDVTGDEATMMFVTNKAKCKDDDLPVVFVASEPIGAYNDLVAADVSGALDMAVFGENRRPNVAKAASHN